MFDGKKLAWSSYLKKKDLADKDRSNPRAISRWRKRYPKPLGPHSTKEILKPSEIGFVENVQRIAKSSC